MPGATYVKGFLRTYATYLGPRSDVILDEYRSRGFRDREPARALRGFFDLGAPARVIGGATPCVFVAVVCLLVAGRHLRLSLGDSGEGWARRPDRALWGSPALSASEAVATAVARPDRRCRASCVISSRWATAGWRSAGGPTGRALSRHDPKGRTRDVRVGCRCGCGWAARSNVRLASRGEVSRRSKSAGPLDYLIRDGKLDEAGGDMAKEASFDVVSRADINEVRNAVQHGAEGDRHALRLQEERQFGDARRRGDWSSSPTTTASSRRWSTCLRRSSCAARCRSRRSSTARSRRRSAARSVSTCLIAQGIPDEKAKAINKLLRQDFKKVKVQIQGDSLRVFSLQQGRAPGCDDRAARRGLGHPPAVRQLPLR